MKLAYIPYFGGTGRAANSDKNKRLGYLVQTLDNLKQNGFTCYVFVQNEEDYNTVSKITEPLRVNSPPEYIPYHVAIQAQKTVEDNDFVLLTEADQLYTIDNIVYTELNDNNFYSPVRMEECYKTFGQTRGKLIVINGKEFVIPNYFNTNIEYKTFGGAIMAKGSAFKKINFILSSVLPVEHITGFSAHKSLGSCLWNEAFVCEHLSGLDYHKKLSGEKND